MSMAGHRVLLLVGFLLPRVLLSEAAKILTISTLGGSHYLLLDRVSQILLEHGHNVTMLLLSGKHLASDTKDKEKSYQVIRWFPPEDYQKTVKERFNNYIEKALDGREETEGLVKDLENFIANFGDAGFVLVAFGSTLDIYESQEVLKNMHSAFAQLPQGVIWKCQSSRWPKDVHLATNVKIMDWLPQSDLLAHPSIRLFVTHGGQNSIMEAIRHGVPMVGLPVNGDQHGNMVRVVAKNYGVVMQLNQVTADTLALKMKQVIEDKRYKSAVVAGSVILHSQPLSAQQRLVGWIDHILQTKGAAHLKPYAFQQPWHEQYLIDVFVFLLMLTLGTVWLCGKLLEPGIVSGTNTAGTTGYYLEKRQYLIETSHHIQN
ncbi:UDP-glucuronosyltransferase 3A1 isoform X2 [Callithrix jacchus]